MAVKFEGFRETEYYGQMDTDVADQPAVSFSNQLLRWSWNVSFQCLDFSSKIKYENNLLHI
jgi:hypothetical protein